MKSETGCFSASQLSRRQGLHPSFACIPLQGTAVVITTSATQHEQSHQQLNPHRSPTISKLHRMSSARERDIGSAIRSFAIPSALPRKVRHNHGDFCNLGTPTMAVVIRLSSLARHVMAEGSVFPKECTSLYQGTAIPEQCARIVFGLAS